MHLRAARGAVKTLNTIFSNLYKDKAELLTGWKTANRVQKSGGETTTPPPTP